MKVIRGKIKIKFNEDEIKKFKVIRNFLSDMYDDIKLELNSNEQEEYNLLFEYLGTACDNLTDFITDYIDN